MFFRKVKRLLRVPDQLESLAARIAGLEQHENERRSDRLHDVDADRFIFVYTMGKVASTSIALSLGRMGYLYRHCQWLNENTMCFFRYGPSAIANRIAESHYRLIRLGLADRHYAASIRVITVVRDPLAQILSHIFHSMPYLSRFVIERQGNLDTASVLAYIREYAERFCERADLSLAEFVALAEREGGGFDFPMFAFLCRNPFKWFDEELRPFFDYNVYEGRFDGYQLDRNILVLKYETLKSEGVRFIRQFTGRPDFELLEMNLGEAGPYGELYQEVRAARPFPKSFLEYAYSTAYATHFYSPEEIKQLRGEWC